MTSFYTLLKRFPPCRVRLLARLPFGEPMSDEQIAKASGFTEHYVALLSQMTDWKRVDVDTVQRFTHACGLDLDDPASVKRKQSYSAGKYVDGKRVPPSFRYLRRSPLWSSFYRPLIERWRDSVYANATSKNER